MVNRRAKSAAVLPDFRNQGSNRLKGYMARLVLALGQDIPDMFLSVPIDAE